MRLSEYERTTRIGRKPASPPQSKATVTEQHRRERGQGRLSLRMPVESLRQLDSIARQLGHSRSRVLQHLIKLADRSRPQNK